MKGSSIFLLLFGIILFGLAYYFLQYSSEEGFQVASNTIIESDKFFNDTLNPVVVDFTGYSNAYKIKQNFIRYFSDWHNYSGYLALTNIYAERRNKDIPNTPRATDIPVVYYEYYDYDGNAHSENLTGKDINFTIDINNNDILGIHHYFPLSLYFNGIRRGPLMEDTGITSWNGPGIYGYHTVIQNAIVGNDSHTYTSYRFDSNTYINKFTTFVNKVASNVINNKRIFLQNLKLWDTANIISKCALNATNNSVYSILPINRNPVLFSIDNFITNDSGFANVTNSREVSYDIGAFDISRFPSQATYLTAAQNEKIRLNVYGSFCNYHSNDFQECIHWGSAFDFSDVNLLDAYLNVSYDDIYFNGSNVWYSYGLFYSDIKPVSKEQSYIYISNIYTFKHNTLLKSLVNYGSGNFFIPTNLNTTVGYDTTGYINSVNYAASATREYFVPLYNPNGTVTFTSLNTTFYQIATVDMYNSKTPQEKFVGIITPQMMAKMPNMMHRYITSWTYNRTQRILDARLASYTDTDYTGKATYLRALATNNSNKATTELNFILAATWNNYLVKYNSVTLNDNTIILMAADFKGCMSKLLPDYGMASTINILDHAMLDSVAQSFYEYSDGLFEITNIYDVYLVGSNMMDIRFDKKQRLAPDSYVTLRNQYIPQINAYNSLLDMYNNGTWVETYSNITDLQSNISTSLKRLEPVLNPIYAVNNANPNTLRVQINTLNTANNTLELQIDAATMTTAAAIRNAGSNLVLLSNLLNPGNSAQNLANLQSQLDSNNETIATLTNQIDGIETNVARVFFTMTSSSNLIINGIALGPNAALTYNTIYNASLQVDMGQSLGNVNYSPTIIYTKNITPNINPSNINFIKQAAQLYMDGITTTLSSFTRDTFRNSNGSVRVDRVYGFTKLDDTTCGFTWQESQYDFYTNKPNVQRIVDVALKFAFDNIEYQNPQIFIDNKVSNIYLNVSNNISPLQSSNDQIMTMFSNYLLSNTIYILSNYRKMYYNIYGYTATGTYSNLYVEFSNAFYTSSNAASLFNTLFSSNFNFNNISNFFNMIDRLPNGPSSNLINYVENSPISELPNFSSGPPTGIAVSGYGGHILNTINNAVSYANNQKICYTLSNSYPSIITFGDGSITDISLRDSANNLFTQAYTCTNIIGKTWAYRQTDNINNITTPETKLTILYPRNVSIPHSKVENYSINYKSLLNRYIYNLNLLNEGISGRFTFDILQNNDEQPFTLNDYINNYKGQVYYPPFESVSSNYRSTSNQSLLSNAMTATNVSNAYVIIPWEPQEEETLDNNDGACPANIVCGSPQVMNQLMDSYNLDSNNNDKIVRILKAFTPNGFQCDYSVEIADSNNRTKKGTLSLQVVQNIEDCSYVIASNSGFNTGYYILDKVKYVQDSTTDISGYQYLNESLAAFSNNVKTVFTPLITSASNAASEMYNAFASSRLLTYTSLGKLNVLSNIGTCGNIGYDKIRTLLYDDKKFLYSIFNTYPYFDSHMNKIIRVGLRQDNMLEVIFERLNLGPISNVIGGISSDTVGALYTIQQDTSNYCSYTTNFLRLSTPSPPSMISNISMNLSAINYNSNDSPVTDLAHIYNDLNIVNPIPIQKIDPVNKKIIKSFLNSINQINLIESYDIINLTTVAYVVMTSNYSPVTSAYYPNYGYGVTTISNINWRFLYLVTFSKAVPFNTFNVQSVNTIPFPPSYPSRALTNIYPVYYQPGFDYTINGIRTGYPKTEYRTTVSKTITGAPSNFILNASIDFGNSYVKNLTGLPNISGYKIEPTDSNTCEYYLGLENVYLPIEKRFFKVKYYTDDWLNANSLNVAIYSITPATISNTLYNIDITGTNRTSLINIFKTYYESVNTSAIIADIHSIDSVVGSSLIANISIIYLDSLGNNRTDILPNIKAFNNDKYFKIYYRQEPELTWNTTTTYNKNNVILYNSLYYTAKFSSTNIPPTNTNLVSYNNSMIQQGQLYWGTGSSTNPIIVYTYEEVNRLSNPTSFTYSNSISIPNKNFYIDNIFWNYVKFNPIYVPYLSQFEFYKDNVKLNVSVKPVNTNYNAIFNYNNVNTSNSSNIKSIPANITVALVYPTNFNGFSITTGKYRTILNWSLDASIDGSNWLTIIKAPQPYFSPHQSYYRSPVYNFKDGSTNLTLPQNPYYGVTLYDCASQLNITPTSPTITNLYNTYSISAFNSDISPLFQDSPKVSVFQNLELVYYLSDYDNNTIYHILRSFNIRTSTYIYILYSLTDFTFSTSCTSISGNTPEFYSLISNDTAQKIITNVARPGCGAMPTIESLNPFYGILPRWQQEPLDRQLAGLIYNWEACTVLRNNFTAVNPPISVVTGTTPPIFNSDLFCTNYHHNDLPIITSNYIGGVVPVRFDISYVISHKKVDRTNHTYSYILSNINYRKIYKYDNSDEEGIIYYTDSLPLNTMIQNYMNSNIVTQPNDLPYVNMGPCELRLTITGSNYTILECADYIDDLLFVESSNYTATITPITTSVGSYASLNNFMFMTTSLSNNIYAGPSDSLTQQFNLYDSISNIKNNCGLNYTNPTILQLTQQVPLFDSDGNQVSDINGSLMYTFNYGNIFDSAIINTLSNTYNFNLNSDTEPYITYGKQDLNDSLKYYYIVCVPGTDISTSADRVMYAEYSIKFYYGSHSNRNYSNYTFITNGGQDECTINSVVTFQHLYTFTNVATYSATANYELLGRMAQYNICSNYINTTYHGLNDFATSPNVSPVASNANGMMNYPTFYYTKLMYTRNRILPYFKKDFVYMCYIMGDFKNPLLLEYSVKINSITNCSNIDFSFNYKRMLTLGEFNNLSNQDYVKYNDTTNFNTRQQLSNCGIDNNYMLSNMGTYQIIDGNPNQYMYFNPMNIDFSIIKNILGPDGGNVLSYYNLGNLEIDLEHITSKSLSYTKYEYKDGISIFSYIVLLDDGTLQDTIDYSIYIFYNSSNCETLISGIEINTPNITGNITQYTTTNSYIVNSVAATPSQLMQLYGLNATNIGFINTINAALSNLKNNATYQNNIFTIQYIKTNYTNLQNNYLATYWSPDTPITLDGLIGTSPLGYLGYTITLSNIISDTNYNSYINSVPISYGTDFDTTGWSNGLTGKFYKNGVLTNTNIRDFSYNASNCFNYYSASNSDIVNFLFSSSLGLDPSRFSITLSSGAGVDLAEGSGLPLGIYAYKKDLVNSNFSYILHYKPANTSYYPTVTISLADDPGTFTPTTCSDFFTTVNDGTNDVVNITYGIGSLTSTQRNNYITNLGYTQNYISNIPAAGFQDYNPTESFADYHIRDPIKKKIETYAYLSLTATNNFRVNGFTLYTSKDSEVLITFVKTDGNSIIVQNPRNLVIIGYSFITNSISSEYDPKEWILKGTNDGRSWTTLDSRKLGKALSRNYQLPLLYLTGNTKMLPQPISRVQERVVEQDSSIDKSMLVKYYKQRINPSITPDYKKFMYDINKKVHYFLHDAYDLNKNLIGKNLIIGFVLQGGKVTKPILYENEDGTQSPFDLTNPHMKQFWEKNIMLALAFEDF